MMELEVGSVVPVNLECGCAEKRITLIRGTQDIKCSRCGKTTHIKVYVDDDDATVRSLDVE